MTDKPDFEQLYRNKINRNDLDQLLATPFGKSVKVVIALNCPITDAIRTQLDSVLEEKREFGQTRLTATLAVSQLSALCRIEAVQIVSAPQYYRYDV